VNADYEEEFDAAGSDVTARDSAWPGPCALDLDRGIAPLSNGAPNSNRKSAPMVLLSVP